MKKAWIAGILFFGSCKSTESINRFARTASTGTAEIGHSVIGFAEICRLYDPAALTRSLDTSVYSKSARVSVPCGAYKTADSLTRLLNQTLVNYFSLLQSVSDKKLLAYRANDLINSLDIMSRQIFPSYDLSEEKISAVKGLLNTILNEPLKWYRYHKLFRTIRDNDSSLSRVLQAYSFILDSALTGEVEQARVNYTSFVYARLYQMAATPVEKLLINQQYLQVLSNFDVELAKIRKAHTMIALIRKDHYMLAYGKPPAGFAYTEQALSEDILLINKLILDLIQFIQ